MRRITLALFALFAACAHLPTQDDDALLRARFDKFLGQPVEELVLEWGAPTSTNQIGELTVYTYVTTGATHSSAFGTNTAFGAIGTGTSWQDRERVDWVVKDGLVVKWVYVE